MAGKTILLADAQPLIRLGLKQLIQSETACEVVGESTEREELLELAAQLRPAVIIIDYNNPGYFTVQDVAEVRRVAPESRILVLSSDNNKDNIHKVLEYGITGFVTKECGESEVLSAISATGRGDRFFCTKVLDLLLEKHFPAQEESCEATELTQREVEIVRLISDGLPARLIAEKLCLSPHTVYTHRKNVMAKLGLRSASELIKYALQTGITRHA